MPKWWSDGTALFLVPLVGDRWRKVIEEAAKATEEHQNKILDLELNKDKGGLPIPKKVI